MEEKFCKYCGAKMPEDAVLCTSCDRQVEELKSSSQTAAQPNIVINNANSNNNNINGGGFAGRTGREKNK